MEFQACGKARPQSGAPCGDRSPCCYSVLMIRTRFAPSPTGPLHLGGARTALFSWLHARHHGGRFILRIEDTDRQRSTTAFESTILEALQWLGLHADEGPFRQSERGERYRETMERLLAEGHAYRCYCTPGELEQMRARAIQRDEKPRYDRSCRQGSARAGNDRPHVLRFCNPLDGELCIVDQVLGELRYHNRELDDFIIARTDGSPTYNFTVVVDDMDMAVTDVIRGADHMNNTPRQVNLYQALGWETPRYAHVPLILGTDNAPLSKRRSDTDILHHRDAGYLPEALLNSLARLGWSYGDQELFTPEELIRLFRLERVQRSAARFDPEKLRHINRQHLKRSSSDKLSADLVKRLRALDLDPGAGPPLNRLVEVLRERFCTLGEMAAAAECYYRDPEHYEAAAAARFLNNSGLEHLRALQPRLTALHDWQAPALHELLSATATELRVGFGKLAQPLRVALCGSAVSPPIDITLSLLGRKSCLRRLQRALQQCDPKREEAGAP